MTSPEHREAAGQLLTGLKADDARAIVHPATTGRIAAAQVHVSFAILDVLAEIRDLIKGTPAGGES